MTEPIEFGKLVEADIREAWKHEAHKFTPWLYGNLDRLGEAIGLQLEGEGVEVPVDTFSADILAANPQTGKKVLIENQLACSDHSHLGQTMTYLAGLDAKIVVWVAADFRQAHLSALKWLNDHTEKEFSFFAVKVKVVRIGNSPLAPVFEVLERPNEWERQLHAVAESRTSRSELSERRYAFWKAFIERVPGAEERDGPANYWSNRWRVLDDIDLIISMYLSKNSVGVFVRGKDADHETTREVLIAKESELSARLGVSMGTGTWAFFQSEIKGDYNDPAQQPALVDWLVTTTDRYEGILREIFGDTGS